MAIPTAAEVRTFLEGYNILECAVSDQWIEDRINNWIVPWIEKKTRLSLTGEVTKEEVFNHWGSSIILLPRKPIKEVISVKYSHGDYQRDTQNYVVFPDEGMIKFRWTRDSSATADRRIPYGKMMLQIKYTWGMNSEDIPFDIREAILMLISCEIFTFLGARTGGGSTFSINGYSRNYGELGKWHDINADFARKAHAILRTYMTGIVP